MAKFVKRNPIKKDEGTTETVDLRELNKKRFSSAPEVKESVSKVVKKEKLGKFVKGFKMYKPVSSELDRLILDKKSEHFGTSKEKDWDGSGWVMFCHKMALELGLDELYQPLDEYDASLTVPKLEIKKHLQKYK